MDIFFFFRFDYLIWSLMEKQKKKKNFIFCAVDCICVYCEAFIYGFGSLSQEGVFRNRPAHETLVNYKMKIEGKEKKCSHSPEIKLRIRFRFVLASEFGICKCFA